MADTLLFTVAFGLVVGLGLWLFRSALIGQARSDGTRPEEALTAPDERGQRFGDPGPDGRAQAQLFRAPLTLWMRTAATLAVIVFLYFLNIHGSASGASWLPADYFWESYMAASAVSAWYLGYMWTYEIVILDRMLIVPRVNFGTREYDLDLLNSIEKRGFSGLRLSFSDGRAADMLRHVRDQDGFMAALTPGR
ncbi:MAG: hypothetical protein AAF841_11220 [Pseudomonadota bacterium]